MDTRGSASRTPARRWWCDRACPYPRTVAHIVTNELCERFCFYGARAILTLYFTDELGFDEPAAVSLYSWWMAACYVSPLLGGFIADRWAGKYATILAFNALYLCGLAVLGGTAFIRSRAGCFIGLLLIAIGTGGIKPNISPFGVDNLEGRRSHARSPRGVSKGAAFDAEEVTPEEREKRRTSFFFMFYFSINLGSVFSYILTPVIRVHAGFGWGFLLSFFSLLASVVILLLAHNEYVLVPPSGSSVYESVYRVIAAACTGRPHRPPASRDPDAKHTEAQPLIRSVAITSGGAEALEDGTRQPAADDTPANPVPARPASPPPPNDKSCLDGARGLVDEAEFLGVRAVVRLLPIFLLLPAFWALFDSQGSIWTVQRRHTDNCLGSPDAPSRLCLTPEQLGALNPLFVLILVPLYDRVIFPALRRTRCAWLQPTPLRRMTAGMVLAAASYVLTALLQYRLDTSPDGSVSALWQVPQILVITASELLVSTTGLEFVYSQAPEAMKGSLIALFYLAVSLGDILTGVLYASLSTSLPPLALILVLAVAMAAASAAFGVVAWRYKPAQAGLTHNA